MDVAHFTNGLRMAFALIPAGAFAQGSEREELGHETSEGPIRQTRITQALHVGVHPVTQDQYAEVMGANPSRFLGARRPLDRVSWHDAVEFCVRLSEREGRTYRLPTEAEWEYACRAGSTTAFCFGDDEDLTGDYAWYGRNSGEQTQEVGTKLPNAWGLRDMHGNVWEWCADWYGPYDPEQCDDPSGPAEGALRVVRGGSYFDHPSPLRSASRGRSRPDHRPDDHGFRVVLEQDH
jgi:formylglycine-generating enzyme required for sulfatase activity